MMHIEINNAPFSLRTWDTLLILSFHSPHLLRISAKEVM